MDVTNSDSIALGVSSVINKAGRIDVLINNAGAGITGPMEEIPEEAMKHNFDTNFFGPINVIKAVLPAMREQKTGLIINITSIAGHMITFLEVYSASKGALEIVTEAFSMELKPFNVANKCSTWRLCNQYCIEGIMLQ